MSAKRKGLGKRLRFEIFNRDRFTCRYCGAQADQAKLVIDHIIPVAKGGTNDPVNLITACEPCNQGKTDREIGQAVPTKVDAMRVIQESSEARAELELQRLAAERASKIAKMESEFDQNVVNFWCQLSGRERMSTEALRHTVRHIAVYGVEMAYECIALAFRRLGASTCSADDLRISAYAYGIMKRRVVNEGGDQ